MAHSDFYIAPVTVVLDWVFDTDNPRQETRNWSDKYAPEFVTVDYVDDFHVSFYGDASELRIAITTYCGGDMESVSDIMDSIYNPED